MNYSHHVLQTIYEIVKGDSDPLTYQCRSRELILRLHEEWNVIREQLLSLQEEALIQLRQPDTAGYPYYSNWNGKV